MSKKRLQSDEMLTISADWQNPASPAHQAILGCTDLAAALPQITKAHNNLAQLAQPAPQGRLQDISKEQGELDGRHDDIIRGSHHLLTGIALLLGPENGAAIAELRDLLVPEGLSSTQKSYRAQAGQAAQLQDRLAPDIRTKTSKIRIDPANSSHTLTHFLDEWISLGQRLGALEDEKARIAPDRSASALLAARNKWIRTVNIFLAIAEDAELDAQTHQCIFGPLQDAEAKADKRGHAPAPAPENEPEPVP